MQKATMQYVRIAVTGVLLLGLISAITFVVLDHKLLKVSVIRPYREVPTQIINIKDGDSIPANVDLLVGESLLWENQTEDWTIQIIAKEFSSPHISPEEAFQLQFEAAGEYVVEYRGLSNSAESRSGSNYFTIIQIN